MLPPVTAHVDRLAVAAALGLTLGWFPHRLKHAINSRFINDYGAIGSLFDRLGSATARQQYLQLSASRSANKSYRKCLRVSIFQHRRTANWK